MNGRGDSMNGATYYYTGETVTLCKHGDLPVYSDGEKEYATCNHCGVIWELNQPPR